MPLFIQLKYTDIPFFLLVVVICQKKLKDALPSSAPRALLLTRAFFSGSDEADDILCDIIAESAPPPLPRPLPRSQSARLVSAHKAHRDVSFWHLGVP